MFPLYPVVASGFSMCEHPIIAVLDETCTPAKVYFKLPVFLHCFDALPAGWRSVLLPCGKCFSCRKSRAFDITVRAVAESRMYDFSSFITLTVDDEHLAAVFPGGLLNHRPWQLFAKRLRKQIGKFRFLMCGEYGSHTARPHYHAIIFGHRFVDPDLVDGGWTDSKVLSQCWPFGMVKVGDVNSSSIAYVAGYQIKLTQKHTAAADLFPAYVKWSRRPGLGRSWFDRYGKSLARSGNSFVFVVGDKMCNFSSRYFSALFRLHYPAQFDIITSERRRRLAELDDTTVIMRHHDNLRKSAVQQYNEKQKAKERML